MAKRTKWLMRWFQAPVKVGELFRPGRVGRESRDGYRRTSTRAGSAILELSSPWRTGTHNVRDRTRAQGAKDEAPRRTGRRRDDRLRRDSSGRTFVESHGVGRLLPLRRDAHVAAA